MRTPNIFIAYAPAGPGLRCALAYLASELDVYGWFIGPCPDGEIVRRYFLLEDFYSPRATRYEAVPEADLHSDWALAEERRHELAQMQDAFAREWLVFRDDRRAAAELQAYVEAGYAAGEVLVRFERLAKFHTEHEVWTYYSQHFEHAVLRFLAKHWPLEYRLHPELGEGPHPRRAPRSCP
jgi:hypothetical protein